jgi:hypothetical protein
MWVEDGSTQMHVRLTDLTRPLRVPVEKDHLGVIVGHDVIGVSPCAHLPGTQIALGLDDLVTLRYMKVKLLRSLQRNQGVPIEDQTTGTAGLAAVREEAKNTVGYARERSLDRLYIVVDGLCRAPTGHPAVRPLPA